LGFELALPVLFSEQDAEADRASKRAPWRVTSRSGPEASLRNTTYALSATPVSFLIPVRAPRALSMLS
jgi:hypothetical protein